MSAMEEGRPALPGLFSLAGKVALVTGARAGMVWRVEPGKFEALIGSSSADIKLKKEFTIITE